MQIRGIKISSLTALFCLTVLVYVIIILSSYAIVTNDGPAHLYNANIINHLLFSNDSVYGKFHSFNPNWLQPNISGYFILCCLLFIVPFLWAEKLLIVIYIILFCFGFRYFLKQKNLPYNWFSFMIFPFVMNTLLFFGFYNFLIGVACSFWFIGFFERHKLTLKTRQIFILTAILLIIYFSHALVFLFCGLYVTVIFLFELIKNQKWTKNNLIYLGKIAIIFLPSILLFLVYLEQQKASHAMYEDGYSIVHRISDLFFQIQAISFSGGDEDNYIQLLFCGLNILTLLKIIYHLKNKKNIFTPLFFVFISYILIHLVLPENAAGGGIITIRTNLFFFLFWMVWISEQPITLYTKSFILVFYLISIPLLLLKHDVIKCAALQCKNVIELSDSLVSQNSVFSTVHYKPVRGYIGSYQIHSYIDLMSNVDNYIAVKHSAITLNNYEANSMYMESYFPIIWKGWKNSVLQNHLLSEYERMECYNIHKFTNKWKLKPQAIISIGSLENVEKLKSLWDTDSSYTLAKTNDIHFINIYKLINK